MAIFKASEEWIDQKLKDGTFDFSYNFVEQGGIAIANVDSAVAAHALIMDAPYSVLYDWEAKPLLETLQAVKHGIAGMEKAIELQKRAGGEGLKYTVTDLS